MAIIAGPSLTSSRAARWSMVGIVSDGKLVQRLLDCRDYVESKQFHRSSSHGLILLCTSLRPPRGRSHRRHELRDTAFVIQLPTLSANHQPLAVKEYNTNGTVKRDVGAGMYWKSMRPPIATTKYRLNQSSCTNRLTSTFGRCLLNHRLRVLRAARPSRNPLVTLLLQFEEMMHAAPG